MTEYKHNMGLSQYLHSRFPEVIVPGLNTVQNSATTAVTAGRFLYAVLPGAAVKTKAK